MWLTNPSNIDHPYRNNAIAGPPIAVNHRRGNDETDGGNVTFVDGHVEYRKATALRAKHFGLADGSSGKAEDTQSAPSNACYKPAF